MKRYLFAAAVFSLFLYSCDKNKELSINSEYFHIVDGNTISYIFVPNTLTPNGDSINDDFKPIANGFIQGNFMWKVYNSNGEVIYQGFDHDYHGWDGTYRGLKVEEGAYTYQITATDISGYEYKLIGIVNLMR